MHLEKLPAREHTHLLFDMWPLNIKKDFTNILRVKQCAVFSVVLILNLFFPESVANGAAFSRRTERLLNFFLPCHFLTENTPLCYFYTHWEKHMGTYTFSLVEVKTSCERLFQQENSNGGESSSPMSLYSFTKHPSCSICKRRRKNWNEHKRKCNM